MSDAPPEKKAKLQPPEKKAKLQSEQQGGSNPASASSEQEMVPLPSGFSKAERQRRDSGSQTTADPPHPSFSGTSFPWHMAAEPVAPVTEQNAPMGGTRAF
jgi:hypothetical protein